MNTPRKHPSFAARAGSLLVAGVLAAVSLSAQAQGGPQRPDDHRGGDRPAASRPHAEPHRAQPSAGHRGPSAHAGRPAHVAHRGGDFRRGQNLPSRYRGKQYVVQDWHGHHLKRPPRGQHWLNVNGDYVLVAIATGVITSIVLGH